MADIITVMNLGWRYAAPGGGGDPIQGLRDASCYVQQGALAGVIGPTGSGKSTLVKALAGIIPHCTKGSLNGYVRIADMNVKSTTVSDLSLRVGYVGQDPRAQLTSPTVAEEIAFPLENRGVEPDEIEARVDDVLAMLHIGDLRDRDTATLSTGEMERVAIGAAIAGEPDVLIVDEPASLLDEEGYEDLVNVIDVMRRRTRMTAVLVEQDTRFLAQRADAVFLMVNGEIIRRTTADIFTRERSLLESVGVIVSDQDAMPLVIESDEPGAADNPAVVFNHVHARYADSPPSDAPQLDDVAFAVQQGDFVAITGGNGSGKSTLTRLVNAELRPDRGQVVVNGIDVASRTPVQMAQQVAVVGQHPADMFCAQSVREEIGFGPRALGVDDDEVARRVNEMVRLFDLYEVEDMPVAALSSGEQRAVALACALVMHAPVLVLDEPAAGLDHRLKSRLLNTVARMNQEGTTVIIATEDADLIQRYCSHAARLDQGRLVSYGRVRANGQRFLAPPPVQGSHAASDGKGVAR